MRACAWEYSDEYPKKCKYRARDTLKKLSHLSPMRIVGLEYSKINSLCNGDKSKLVNVYVNTLYMYIYIYI